MNNITCRICQKVFKAKPSQGAKYCSHKCYAIARTGIKAKPFTADHRKNLSDSKKGKPSWAKGKKFSKEHREKLSIAKKGKETWNKGIPRSEETKRKISIAKKGTIPWNYGKPPTKEVKEKISKSLYGRFRGEDSPLWKGDQKKKFVYKMTSTKDRKKTKQKYLHRYIMEKIINRPLKEQEIVHHVDGNSLNNHPNNLKLLKNQSEHIRAHSVNRHSKGSKS